MKKYIVCSANGVEIDGVPTEVKILPLGHVISRKGDFDVDEESFRLMQQHFKDRGIDIVVDYEHQTLDDVQAPAGGWIKELYKGEDAIIAKIEWTPKAAEYLKNKEYKYLSPVVLTRKIDKKAVLLHSVALTNTPAIDGMFPIINAVDIDTLMNDKEGDNKIMDLEKLIQLLGLAPDATEEDVTKALAELQKEADKAAKAETEIVANKTVLELLELKEDAKTEDVTAKIMSFKTGGDTLVADVLALKEKLQKKETEELVMTALKEGKISASQKEWAQSYALKDPEGFKGFMEKAPKAVPTGKINYDADKTNSEDDLNMEVLKQLGVSKEDALKYGI